MYTVLMIEDKIILIDTFSDKITVNGNLRLVIFQKYGPKITNIIKIFI